MQERTPTTILVVDDEVHNRTLLDALLRPEGHVTVHAATGAEALAAVAEHVPDLILLDIILPDMDGYDVARRLKADRATSSVPIIMVTAQLDRDARLKGLDAGAEDFLTKPVDRAELGLRVRNLLRLKQVQESLERARDEANRANQAKSEFLSRMSHELRTPLNAVLGFSQILLMDDLAGDQRENVQCIRSAGRHLLGLINEVLDIARIEAGALELLLEPVSVLEVVGTTLDLVRSQALARGVTITAPDDVADVVVLADRQRLTQVLLNTLSNAVKYNRPNGTVMVSCERSGGTVSIAVTDTGIGMTHEGLAKLFTPFERLGAEHTDIEGTGIGMSLSRVLSQHMGGALTAYSTLGHGSTFLLELPEATDVAPAVTERADQRVEPLLPTTGSEAITVLCFEDNVANVRLIENAMRRLPNVHLVTAIQGRIGLDLALQVAPDAILLDVQLPDMSGAEVLRRLRAGPTTASIPVLITSADVSPGQAEALLGLGASAYLTKPLDLMVLFEHLEQIRAARPPARVPLRR